MGLMRGGVWVYTPPDARALPQNPRLSVSIWRMVSSLTVVEQEIMPADTNLARRRKWLLNSLRAGVAVTLGAIFYPVVRFLWPRPATSSGELQVVAPYRVHELRPDAQGRWPAPFNFGGKPCLLVRTPDGEVRGLQRALHPRGLHGRVSPGAERYLLQLPQRCLRSERAQRLRSAAPAAGDLQGDPGSRTPGQEEIIVSRST